jgi:hypothetical protein
VTEPGSPCRVLKPEHSASSAPCAPSEHTTLRARENIVSNVRFPESWRALGTSQAASTEGHLRGFWDQEWPTELETQLKTKQLQFLPFLDLPGPAQGVLQCSCGFFMMQVSVSCGAWQMAPEPTV